MQKISQQYFCNTCGTTFSPDHLRQTARYPEWLKDAARISMEKNPQKTCQDIANELNATYNLELKDSVIRYWIVIEGKTLIKNAGKKRWKSRKKRFGPAGFSDPEKFSKTRQQTQKELWLNSAYRKHMKEIHKKPRYYDLIIISTCIELYKQGKGKFSYRKIALFVNKLFGTTLVHDTISHWIKEGDAIWV
jgi:hypothetical protein